MPADRRTLLALPLAALPLAARAGGDEIAAISAMLNGMAEAWNKGDFRGYMAGFANPDIAYISRGKRQPGWDATLQHYLKYYGGDPAKRGHLIFSQFDIQMLSPEAAQLIARFDLKWDDGRTDGGLFSGVVRKRDGRWVITLNHVQAETPDPRDSNADAEKAAITQVIRDMEAAWNRGDFNGYMAGFANPDVIFVSRGQFQKDWQGTLDHYIRDYGTSADTRGVLTFSNIKIELLAPDAAQLISNYQLNRPGNPQTGINTRLMRKRNGRWVIALNHVSSIEQVCPPR
ncbi:nuclear transport factor 2 family protein [Sandaracinobacter neustonicus]|nr:nuclear transport factor 2 family protein [Sandaracinobacter neustonicus]